MAKIDAVCKEVLDKSEWIAIATTGPDGPHLVATWGDHLRALSIEDGTLLIPVGHMHKTEANLSSAIALNCYARRVRCRGLTARARGAASSARQSSRPRARISMHQSQI